MSYYSYLNVGYIDDTSCTYLINLKLLIILAKQVPQLFRCQVTLNLK